MSDGLHEIAQRLDRIERCLNELQTLREAAVEKESYTVEEAARRLGLAKWTLRNACRTQRVAAVRERRGIGVGGRWRIPHAELVRLLNHGLPPGDSAH